METINCVEEWMIGYPYAVSILQFTFWVVIILLAISLVRKLLKRSLPDNSIRYKSQK